MDESSTMMPATFSKVETPDSSQQPQFTVPAPLRVPPPRQESAWKKLFGPLTVVGVLLLKFGVKLKFLVLPVIKFLPVILKTGGTMLLSIGAYAMVWGWKYALGFVLLIFVHEMGHVVAARKFGVPASAPMFIPFMGAFIALKGRMKNAYEEAEIGIAGPLYGSAGAALCHATGMAFDMPLLVALAWSGYFLNLFNLTPVGQLDGGHVAQALTPWMWLAGFGIMLWLAITRPSFIIWLLLAMSVPRLLSLFRKRTAEEVEFYTITPTQRWKMAFMYFALIGALAYQMQAAHEFLAPVHRQ
jgi:Zn-dependent protease